MEGHQAPDIREGTLALTGACPQLDGPAIATPAQRARKQPQDTIAGCRALAAANLIEAAAATGAHPRLRLELSAATWASRANLLQRLADGQLARNEAGQRSR